MPIKNTEYVRNLKKQYGRNWMRVYYARRAKYPYNPEVLKAEGLNPGWRGEPFRHSRAAMLAWRKRQRRGAIMKPETFASIVKKSSKKYGSARAKKVAGAAYWQTAKSKWRKSA